MRRCVRCGPDVPSTTTSARSQGRSASKKRDLLGHPLVPEGLRVGVAAVARDPAALRLGEVGLHPDERVEVVAQLPAARADALDDHDARARRDLDRARPAARVPRRRSVGHRASGAGVGEHAAEQFGPAEERVMPGEVVGVQHGARAQRLGEGGRDRRLARTAASVHRHDADERLGASPDELVRHLPPCARSPRAGERLAGAHLSDRHRSSLATGPRSSRMLSRRSRRRRRGGSRPSRSARRR